MPHCNVDQLLLNKVNSLIASCGGNVAAAAELIGVSRGKLWRFRRAGRAIGGTRTEIATGLERLAAAPAQNATRNESKNETGMDISPKTQWEPADMRRLKHMCELVISLVDQHVESGSGLAPSRSSASAVA